MISLDLDIFTLQAVRLEIQTYYFAPSPKADKGALRRNVARAYHTARTLLELAHRLEAAQAFLTHGPHHVFRTVLEAASVIVISCRSVYTPDLAAGAADEDVRSALRALRTCIVQEGDLAARSAKMLESYWSLRHLLPVVGLGLSQYRKRVGAVVVFDCLKRWQSELGEAKKAGCPPAAALAEQRAAAAGMSLRERELHTPLMLMTCGLESAPDANADFASLQDIDWPSLVMDFDWTNNDLTYLPTQ
jgi:transcriptional regulatory protein LEU3